MNLNFQHIINESVEDNPKIENMMFRLFNREFFNIWRDEDDSPYKTALGTIMFGGIRTLCRNGFIRL